MMRKNQLQNMPATSYGLPTEVVRSATHRRGRLELFDAIDAGRTALLVIDMQQAWLAAGAPFETPPARALIPAINRLAAALRRRAGMVVWIQHTSGRPGEIGHWPLYFQHFIREEGRAAAIAALAPGAPLHALNPVRLEYIAQRTELSQRRLADIGCGGGLLGHPLVLAQGFDWRSHGGREYDSEQ